MIRYTAHHYRIRIYVFDRPLKRVQKLKMYLNTIDTCRICRDSIILYYFIVPLLCRWFVDKNHYEFSANTVFINKLILLIFIIIYFNIIN